MTKFKLQVDRGQFMNVVLNAAIGDGLVPPGKYDFIKERGDKKLIVVAAAPRSGSTYLTNALGGLLQLPYARLCAAYSTNEHDLSVPALVAWNRTGCVSQLHMKGTFHNATLLRAFGIRPIILVRSIFDIVVSLRDDLRQKEKRKNFGSGRHGYSFVWHDETIMGCSDDELLDVIVDLAVPWYVNFYVSWYRLCARGEVDAKWVTYEGMMEDRRGTFECILEFVGASNVSGTFDEAIRLRAKTFNIGGSGRGRELLSTAQQERIERLFSYYPDVNFEKYGLERRQSAAVE